MFAYYSLFFVKYSYRNFQQILFLTSNGIADNNSYIVSYNNSMTHGTGI